MNDNGDDVVSIRHTRRASEEEEEMIKKMKKMS